jgi:hypothetical protein
LAGSSRKPEDHFRASIELNGKFRSQRGQIFERMRLVKENDIEFFTRGTSASQVSFAQLLGAFARFGLKDFAKAFIIQPCGESFSQPDIIGQKKAWIPVFVGTGMAAKESSGQYPVLPEELKTKREELLQVARLFHLEGLIAKKVGLSLRPADPAVRGSKSN